MRVGVWELVCVVVSGGGGWGVGVWGEGRGGGEQARGRGAERAGRARRPVRAVGGGREGGKGEESQGGAGAEGGAEERGVGWAGGKAAGGQLVEQRFCPRIVGASCATTWLAMRWSASSTKPKEGGISAVSGTGSIYTCYGPKDNKFATLTKNFATIYLPKVMPALGLGEETAPLWWTSYFMNSSPPGTDVKDEK